MKKALFFMAMLSVLSYPAYAFTSCNAGTYCNSSWNMTIPITLYNNLSANRYNATFIFNVTTDKNFVKSSCEDVRIVNNTLNGAMLFNLSHVTNYCEVRLFTNMTANQNLTVHAYYNYTGATAPTYYENVAETIWLYDNTSQFVCIEGCATGCGISPKTVDGQTGITMDSSSSQTCYYNITDWYTYVGGDIGNDYEIDANISKEPTPTGTNWGIGSLFLQVNGTTTIKYAYEGFMYRNDNTINIRNITNGGYGTSTSSITPLAYNVWYYRELNKTGIRITHSWTNASSRYTITRQYAGLEWINNPAGIGGSDFTGWTTNLTFKSIRGLVYKTNRNFTLYTGSSEFAPQSTSIALWIDNAQANISTACSAESNHNYTAQITPSGLNVSILYNGYHGATNETIVNWYASLIAGVFNITGNYSGNGTYGASSTWLQHTITLGNATSNVSLMANTTPIGNNTTCANVPLNVTCGAWVLEDGVNLWSDLGGYHDVGNPYYYTPSIVGVETFKCNWTINDCYTAGETTRQLEVVDCGILPAGYHYPINDNTVICFTTKPICVNLKDNSIIYRKEGYYD